MTTRRSNLKQMMVGALISTSGAYAWAVLFFSFYASREGWMRGVPIVAGYAVLVASWFVVPMGAALGVVIPRIIHRCPARSAILRGALLGIGAGVLANCFTMVLEEWPILSG